MSAREISAHRFKAECLRLLDQVAATGEDIVVTKRGRKVARIAPIEEPRTLRRSVTYLVDDDELVAPFGGRWDSER